MRTVQSLTILLLAISCAGGGGGSKQRVLDPPAIAIDPPERTVLISTTLAPGTEWIYRLCVSNQVSGSELILYSVTLDPPKLCENDDPAAFSLRLGEEVKFPMTVVGPGDSQITGKPETFCFDVVYIVQEKECVRVATLHIKSNTRDVELQDLTVTFKTEIPVPHLVVAPSVVDLGRVEEGSTAESSFVIRNTGLGELEVTRLTFVAQKPGFAFAWKCEWSNNEGVDEEGQKWIVIPREAQGTLNETTCKKPLVVAGNNEFRVRVKYGASDDEDARAFLTLFSNDPENGASGVELEIRANVGGPCLRAVPEVVDFSTVVKGSFQVTPVDLQSCGDKTVEVTSIALEKGASSPFQLDFQGLNAPTEASPWVLNPGERKTFVVAYLPLEAKKDPDGKPVADTDNVKIINTSHRPEIVVPVTGTAVEGTKPVCDFRIMSKKQNKEVGDGDSVLVLDTLIFYDLSYDPMPGGKIAAWEWTAEAPPGSADVFQPSYKFPNPTFAVNVVGDYRFCLKVFNLLGISSDSCCKLVHVKAGEGCVVELTWETPNDPDPTDQCGTGKHCGSDVDLHVVHRYASSPDIDKDGKPDGFFDTKYDCFWFNPGPIWVEGGDPLEQPSLDRDDTDGAGPENFRYYRPPPEECYKVGVHYWDDHTFGASYATIRVFINGDLRYQKKSPKLVMLDMWEVGEVCCGNVDKPFKEYTIGGGPVIIHNYVNPEFDFTPGD